MLQLGLCLVAMHLICWQLTGCQYFCAQECEKFFASKFHRVCHQGQFEGENATVIESITYKQPKNSVMHANINVCLQRCSKAVAWGGISWRVCKNANKSQKPSQVNGVLPITNSHVTINSKAKGLITPETNANNNWQRCENSRSMAAKLRRNRQRYLGNS